MNAKGISYIEAVGQKILEIDGMILHRAIAELSE